MDRNNTNSMRELVADSVISILETNAANGKTYQDPILQSRRHYCRGLSAAG